MKNLVIFLLIATTIFRAAPLASEIPFNQALGTYEDTKEEYKDISPFWGMVAIHGRLLENLRFFGNYEQVEQNDRKIDVAQDAIASLIQSLFPSPDGVQFVANTNNQDPVGNLGRHLEKIGNVILILIDKKSSRGEKTKHIMSLLKNLDKNTKNRENEKFTTTLLNAYEAQERLANPKKPESRLYPENIVIISLLGFFVKIADSKHDIEKLSFLLNGNLSDDVFTKEAYKKIRAEEDMNAVISSFEPRNIELSFLMAHGYSVYETSFPTPIYYKSGVCFKNIGKFPDCGETSLRNILMLLLAKGGTVEVKTLEDIKNKITPTANADYEPLERVINYFKKYPSLENSSSSQAHDDWAEVVSELNKTTGSVQLEDIQYGRGEKDKTPIFEIKSNFSNIGVKGVINMLNVIARLIPDETLNEAWPKKAGSDELDEAQGFALAKGKLSRFFELLSKEGFEISWKNKQGEENIFSHFIDIFIKINGEHIYTWKFTPGHFQIDRIVNKDRDWGVKYADLFEYQFINEWMASLYLRFDPDKLLSNPDYGNTFPLAIFLGRTASLRSLDSALVTIWALLYKDMPLKPFIKHIIEKSVYLNDEIALQSISLLLYAAYQDSRVKNDVENLLQKFPQIALRTNAIANRRDKNTIVSEMAKSKVGILGLLFIGDMVTAISQSDHLSDEILKRLPNVKTLDLAENNKVTDTGLAKLINLSSLDLSYNKKITDQALAKLINLTTLELSGNGIITDAGLRNLINLTTLDLRFNSQITDIALENLPNLTTLSLDGNTKITNEGLAKLTNLTSLSLDNNQIILGALEKLPNLTHLVLGQNDLVLDDELSKLTKLTSLDLANNKKITDAGLKNLSNLTSLSLGYDSAVTDAGLENLTNLSSLRLSNNKNITHKAFENLTRLISLDLYRNKTITDRGLENLTKLTDLDLRENEEITDTGIEKLSNLISLSLVKNKKITNIGLQRLTKLTTLDLSWNNLITDAGLEKLTGLKTLVLKGNNQITEGFINSHPDISIVR